VLGLAVALVAALATIRVIGTSWIAYGIVVAPNSGKSFDTAGDALPEQLASSGISEQVRLTIAPAGSSAISMSVWIVEPAEPPRGTVLVLHGIRSDKTWLLGLAKQVAGEGYRAVLPDLRGHGRTSGEFLSYGVHEVRDLMLLIDDLARRGRLSGPLGVVGSSYGAAVGIQLAAAEPRVRAVVAIAPFSSLRSVVPTYVESYLPLLGRLVPDSFVQRGVDEAGAIADFEPDAASPLDGIVRTRAQVLLIHGRDDRHIPPQHSIALHEVAPDHSQLILVDAEDHDTIAADRTRTIARQGMQWLHRWLAPTSATH
jgi:pimeloyl-ACP methyl ester carboxylesterase